MFTLNYALKGKKVLVTGATGFIGGRLAQRLAVEEKAVVTGLGRQLDKVPFLAEAGVQLKQADMRDTAVLRQLLAGQEIVFHAAALRLQSQPSAAEAEAVNVQAVGNLVRLAAETGARRVIHISSINAYGPPTRDLIDETYPLNPDQRDFYGRTKAQAEQVARTAAAETGIELVIVRPGMVYGPRSESWSTRIVETLRQGIPVIFGEGDGYAYPTFIDNLVDGLLLTAVRPEAAGEAFNFVDEPVTWRQFFGYYAEMSGEKARQIPLWAAHVLAFASEKLRLSLPLTRERLKFYVRRTVFPITKAETLLGYRPRVGIDDGMEQAEVWLREAGFLNRRT